MKTKLFLMSFITFIMGLSIASCTNETNIPQEKPSEMIEYGKKFATIHNDCLGYIYQELGSAKTRGLVEVNEKDLQELVLSFANRYILKNSSTRSTNNPLTSEMYTLTLEDIQKSLSQKEKEYIDKALSCQPSSLNNLINEVNSDLELQEMNKQAVICFISTLQASSQYWAEHSSEWEVFLDKPKTRALWSSVAFADAWWGYQGLMSSGLNPWVGGGAAAVGSACAFLH